jgi:hypothetical protein
MPSMLSGMSRAFIRPGMVGGNRREMSAATLGRLQLRASIKGSFVDRPKISRMIGKMNARALGLLGRDVRQAAKQGIGRGSGKVTKAAKKRLGRGKPVEFVGGLYLDITAYGSGEPNPAGQPIKSWAPKRWFYKDIMYFYDPAGRGSVVIGTLKTKPWLAQLHQMGGTVKQTAWRIGVGAARNAYLRKRGNGRQGRDEKGRFTNALPQRNQYEYGALQWVIDKGGFRYSRNWEKTSITRMARYPARPFMAGSKRVDAAVAKANEKWRNMLARN